LFTEESSFKYARGNVPHKSCSTDQTDRGAQCLGLKSDLSVKIDTQTRLCASFPVKDGV